jgi:hypothetical protein
LAKVARGLLPRATEQSRLRLRGTAAVPDDRHSSRSSSCARTLSGRARLPPPTTIGLLGEVAARLAGGGGARAEIHAEMHHLALHLGAASYRRDAGDAEVDNGADRLKVADPEAASRGPPRAGVADGHSPASRGDAPGCSLASRGVPHAWGRRSASFQPPGSAPAVLCFARRTQRRMVGWPTPLLQLRVDGQNSEPEAGSRGAVTTRGGSGMEYYRPPGSPRRPTPLRGTPTWESTVQELYRRVLAASRVTLVSGGPARRHEVQSGTATTRGPRSAAAIQASATRESGYTTVGTSTRRSAISCM